MRMDPDLSLAERGEIFAAARHAFSMYRWLVAPDGDQQEEIQRVTALIRPAVQKSTPLLGVAHAAYDWLAQGGRRAPMRAAMVRYWVEVGLLRIQVHSPGPGPYRANSTSVPFIGFQVYFKTSPMKLRSG